MDPDLARVTPALPDDVRPRLRTFSALRHRAFVLFWLGLLFSLVGGWMQQLAAPWLVYRLTGSAFDLGLVGFIAIVPAAPLSLIAGPLVDRFPRRWLLLATQCALFLPPVGLALLTWAGAVRVWHVVLAEALRGLVATLDQPAKQVAVMEMTGRDDVGSALALWSAAISVARVVGPALAGVVVAWRGEALCFLINGVSYLAVVAALLAIRLPELSSEGLAAARRVGLTGSLVEGLRYLAGQRMILVVAGLSLAASVFVRPYQTLLPVFAQDVLAVGATGLGLLSALSGLGAVLGALLAASVRPARQWRLVAWSSVGLPVVLAGFAFAPSVLPAGLLLVGVGALTTALETGAMTFVQVEVADGYRGRVMSLFGAAAMGAPRIGGLQAGWLASRWGAPWALAAGAGVSLALSAAGVGAGKWAGRTAPEAERGDG